MGEQPEQRYVLETLELQTRKILCIGKKLNKHAFGLVMVNKGVPEKLTDYQ